MTERVIALAKRAGAFVKAGARGVVSAAVRLKNDAAYRKNACAAAALAVTVAVTVFSIDYLITGGPDWNPGAPRIVPEAHAATIERASEIATPRVQTIDIMAIAPMEALDQELTLATYGVDDLLGGPDGDAPATLQSVLAEEIADETIKGEPADYIVSDGPRPSKLKPVVEL